MEKVNSNRNFSMTFIDIFSILVDIFLFMKTMSNLTIFSFVFKSKQLSYLHTVRKVKSQGKNYLVILFFQIRSRNFVLKVKRIFGISNFYSQMHCLERCLTK